MDQFTWSFTDYHLRIKAKGRGGEAYLEGGGGLIEDYGTDSQFKASLPSSADKFNWIKLKKKGEGLITEGEKGGLIEDLEFTDSRIISNLPL